MRIVPIEDGNLASAEALLVEGFPERSPAFWRQGLDRLRRHCGGTGIPIGHLMLAGGEPVGVILTIAGDETQDGGRAVNLSSWYVRQKHRWLAPRMLQKLVADENLTYVDPSPSPETQKINAFLGFRTVTQGVSLFPLPFTALAGGGPATVLSHESLPAGALSPVHHALMQRHHELGCICAAVKREHGHVPLIFSPTARYGLPVARMIHAGDRQVVGQAGGAIARFLMRRGFLFMTLHADAHEGFPGGFFWNANAPVQVKGRWDGKHVDQTFSEAVFLRM